MIFFCPLHLRDSNSDSVVCQDKNKPQWPLSVYGGNKIKKIHLENIINTPLLPAIQLGLQSEYNICVYLKEFIVPFIVRISRKREGRIPGWIQDISHEISQYAEQFELLNTFY